MQPYDWCDPRCPTPCSCQETIEENLKRDEAAPASDSPSSDASPVSPSVEEGAG